MVDKYDVGDCRLARNWKGRGARDTRLFFVFNKTKLGSISAGGGLFVHDDCPVDANGVADIDKYLAADLKVQVDPAPLRPGEYYPRIHRGGNWPPSPTEQGNGPTFDQLISLERSASQLDGMLSEILEVVEPAPAAMDVHGHRIRHLLILACTEVESCLQAVLKANGNTSSGNYWTTRDYVKLLKPMRLDEWRVRLALHPQSPEFQPFKLWDHNNPTKSLPWYDAYNATKHDRETALNRATLRQALAAMAALYIMAKAQFGPGAYDNFAPSRFKHLAKPQWAFDELYFKFHPGLAPVLLAV